MIKIENKFSEHYALNVSSLDEQLRVKDSFDVVGREIKIDKRNAKLYFIDGFCKDETLAKTMAYFMKADEKTIKKCENTREFVNTFIPYVETDVVSKVGDFIKSVLSGGIGMIVEGFGEGSIIDART